MSWLNAPTDFFSELGFVEGVLLIFVILFYRDSVKSRDRELVNRQKEIDRLARKARISKEVHANFGYSG